MIKRRISRKIRVGRVFIGGDAPVLVQSMTNTFTKDADSTIAQIKRLEKAGCELVRFGVPDMESAQAIGSIVNGTSLPVCADIHFDANLAIEAVHQGVHKLRLNPGNLRDKDEVRRVVRLCLEKNVPIRIGVNAGSLDPELYRKYGGITASAMVESAMNEVRLLEEVGFKDILISLKASSVPVCVESYRQIADLCDYPLHIGITEAGTKAFGTIKSSVGLGILLYEGIGDTLRVSLTANPEDEVYAAWDILKALEIRRRGPEVISCPTCARTGIDIINLAQRVEDELKNVDYPLRVAVMGCVVNGPGEAKEADLGIAGGKGRGVIFKKGEKIRTENEENLLSAFMEEVHRFIGENKAGC